MRRVTVLAASVAVVLAAVGAASPKNASDAGSSAGGWKHAELGQEAWPNAINERGQIVGQSQTGKAILWQNGHTQVLRVPAGEDMGYANAVNDRGEIVGGDVWGQPEHAVVWRQGVPEVLPSLTDALDINNRGQIVGRRGHTSVIWESGRVRTLPGVACRALAINDHGVVVGACGGSWAALWKQGLRRKLMGTSSEAVDINNRSQVVGWRRTARGEPRHGFLWQAGRVVDLGAGFLPNAINDRGQIVGSCRYNACVWQSGKITRLFDPERSGSEATAINERQQIVGHWADDCGGDCYVLETAYLWTYKP